MIHESEMFGPFGRILVSLFKTAVVHTLRLQIQFLRMMNEKYSNCASDDAQKANTILRTSTSSVISKMWKSFRLCSSPCNEASYTNW